MSSHLYPKTRFSQSHFMKTKAEKETANSPQHATDTLAQLSHVVLEQVIPYQFILAQRILTKDFTRSTCIQAKRRREGVSDKV